MLLVVAVGVAAVCVRLGFWQLHRLSERRAFNAEIRAGLALPSLGKRALIREPSGGAVLAYRRVALSGRYDAAHEILLYGRSLDGAPGNHVLTPLLLDGGTALIVDRGWVPLDVDHVPASGGAAAPSATVRITGVLMPAEPPTDVPASPAFPSLVRSIDPGALAGVAPYRLLTPYLLLETQEPPQSGGVPQPVPLPELSEGPHLSYAIQWFVFATVALVGYGVLWRRDRREGRAPREAAGSGTQEGGG